MLIRTGARTVKITNNVGHTSLVAHNGGQVNGLLGVILCMSMSLKLRKSRNTYLREGLNLSAVTGSSLTGKETKRPMAGCFVLFFFSIASISYISTNLTMTRD